MLTMNALIMKTVIYSVNNTLRLSADQHILGENNFFQEPSKKGVAWEMGYFCLLCIPPLFLWQILILYRSTILARNWICHSIYSAVLSGNHRSTLEEVFGYLQQEMPGSDLPVFRFSASRYDSFQGRYLNQPPSNCAIKVLFLCTEHTGRLLG